MFIVFILILVVGLAGFAFVFMKALKGRDAPEPVLLRPLDKPSEKLSGPSKAEAAPVLIPTGDPAQVARLKALCQEEQLKSVKLEEMIDEKNKMIEDLQKSSRSGHDHDAQVDGLKQILQAQIEELKQQNRELKAEIARLSQENIDLQTKVYAGQVSREPPAEQIVIHPAASTFESEKAPEPAVEEKKEHPENAHGQVHSLSLHDVFGAEEEKNS